MRILGIGDYGDLGDLYWRLQMAGHDVRLFIEDPQYHGVFSGMIARTADWRHDLDWIRQAGKDGVILVETAHHGHLQDDLRKAGYQVVGGSAWGDRLEQDRAFGQEIMRQVGMRTAPVTAFTTVHEAIAFIEARPRRYVYKHNGTHMPSSHNVVGVLPDGSDVIALLRHYHTTLWSTQRQPDFVLMDHIDGVETGIGGYFNGSRFVGPVCLDWEHKRFFNDDLGELTGEMGTVVTYRGAERLFHDTLLPMTPLLRAGGYQGYINLNTIINADGVWPLEFTCRFGYPGFAILDPLHRHGWHDVLAALCGHQDDVATSDGFAVGVVMTAPPFPYAESPSCPSSCGLPLVLGRSLTADDHRHLHFGEVGYIHGDLHVTGPSGYVLVATGCGPTVPMAQHAAYRLLQHVHVRNGRYRTDIGDKVAAQDAAALQQWGYLPTLSAASATER